MVCNSSEDVIDVGQRNGNVRVLVDESSGIIDFVVNDNEEILNT